jgi:hypothetical protein
MHPLNCMFWDLASDQTSNCCDLFGAISLIIAGSMTDMELQFLNSTLALRMQG